MATLATKHSRHDCVAYIEALQLNIEYHRKNIDDNLKHLEEIEAKLAGIFDNRKGNNAIEKIKKSIERSEREIMLINSSLDRKDSMTYEQMVEMRKGENN